MGVMLRILAVIVLGAGAAQAQRELRSSTRFEAPGQTFNEPAALQTLAENLGRGSFDQAATQIEALLANSDQITAIDERGLASVGNRLDVIAARHVKEITAAYSAQFDPAARRAP
jgi:hypothetical protein